MASMIKKNFNKPDDTKQPSAKIKFETVELNGHTLSRVTCDSGWRWSVDLKPVFNTDSCQIDHFLYVLSGKMMVKSDDGQELEYESGDIAHIPPGHDGWDIANEPTVWLEIPH